MDSKHYYSYMFLTGKRLCLKHTVSFSTLTNQCLVMRELNVFTEMTNYDKEWADNVLKLFSYNSRRAILM